MAIVETEIVPIEIKTYSEPASRIWGNTQLDDIHEEFSVRLALVSLEILIGFQQIMVTEREISQCLSRENPFTDSEIRKSR